ncbi:MAG: hypothetical protein IKM66_04885 [Clostridia bacterium]|nr:hypothetical protein [Clostridia bacterium]
MKKILCVIFALLMCMVVLFAGCGDSPKGGVVDHSDNDNVVNGDVILSDNKIEEGATTVEEELGVGVETFISGKYYLEGVVYSEGEVMPLILATDGKNYQFTANYSGVSLGMLLLDDSTYVVLPREKQYAVLSEALISALDLDEGLGVNDFQAITNENEGVSNASMSQFSVTINGEAGLCTVYTFADSYFKLYSIGDKLIQIESFDLDDTMTMQIVVDELSAQIPADQLTLKGLEEATPTSFIKGLMNSITL